jgi:hypothetical protein
MKKLIGFGLLTCFSLFLIFTCQNCNAQSVVADVVDYPNLNLAPNQFLDTVQIIYPNPANKQPVQKNVVILLNRYTVDANNENYLFASWVKLVRTEFKQSIDWHVVVVNGEIYLIHCVGDSLEVIDSHDQHGKGQLNSLHFMFWDNVLKHLILKYVGNLELVTVDRNMDSNQNPNITGGIFPPGKFNFIDKYVSRTPDPDTTYLYSITGK